MQKMGATGDGKSAVATPDGKKPKEEEEFHITYFSFKNHVKLHTRKKID